MVISKYCQVYIKKIDFKFRPLLKSQTVFATSIRFPFFGEKGHATASGNTNFIYPLWVKQVIEITEKTPFVFLAFQNIIIVSVYEQVGGSAVDCRRPSAI